MARRYYSPWGTSRRALPHARTAGSAAIRIGLVARLLADLVCAFLDLVSRLLDAFAGLLPGALHVFLHGVRCLRGRLVAAGGERGDRDRSERDQTENDCVSHPRNGRQLPCHRASAMQERDIPGERAGERRSAS